VSNFADKYRVETGRKLGWNYSNDGDYFITICALNKGNLFGKIVDGEMILNKCGMIANNYILEIPKHFANVCLSAFVVMPNHVHILFHVETPNLASLQDNRKITLINYSHDNHPNYFPRLSQKSKQLVPKIIQQYKAYVKRQTKIDNIWFGWQSSYYDEIIENEKRFKVIKYYIKNNPNNWEKDRLNK